MQIRIPNKSENKPNNNDYAIGYYYRFFTKQSNNIYSEVYEISANEYNNNLSNPFYRVLRLKMCIGKDKDTALAVNSTVLRTANMIMPGIYGKYINSALKYWREDSNKYDYKDSLLLNYANVKYVIDNKDIHYSILSRKNIDFLKNSDIFINKNNTEKYEIFKDNIHRYDEIQNTENKFPEKMNISKYPIRDVLSISFTTELDVFLLTKSSTIIMTEKFIGIDL